MRFEILPKMTIFIKFINIGVQKCQGVSPPIGRRDMYYSSLDSSRQGASNGGRFMSLASLDKKLFVFFIFSFLLITCYPLIPAT